MRCVRTAVFIVAGLLVVACGAGDEAADDSTTQRVPTTSTEAPTTTVATTPLKARPPGGDLVRCDNEEGFSIAYPAGWVTNPGDVIEACSQFNPEPFDVPVSDERVAPITTYVDPVPFDRAMSFPGAKVIDRAWTVVDGRQAVRVEYTTDGDLWPEGTPITFYAVDVSPGPDEPATLFLDSVGLNHFDYLRNQVVLDRMARSVEISLNGIDSESSIVASYMGATGFSVGGTVAHEVCLAVIPGGEPRCVALPDSDEIDTVELVDLQPVLAGVAGERVFRVTRPQPDGDQTDVLPAPIGSSPVRGFSFATGPDAGERLAAYDILGNRLDTARVQG